MVSQLDEPFSLESNTERCNLGEVKEQVRVDHTHLIKTDDGWLKLAV